MVLIYWGISSVYQCTTHLGRCIDHYTNL